MKSRTPWVQLPWLWKPRRVWRAEHQGDDRPCPVLVRGDRSSGVPGDGLARRQFVAFSSGHPAANMADPPTPGWTGRHLENLHQRLWAGCRSTSALVKGASHSTNRRLDTDRPLPSAFEERRLPAPARPLEAFPTGWPSRKVLVVQPTGASRAAGWPVKPERFAGESENKCASKSFCIKSSSSATDK